MNVYFDFLTDNIELSETCVNTLCIENAVIYRNVISSFLSEEPENSNIYFSEKFAPIKFKGNVCFINDFYALNFSNTFMKKLYEQIEKYCVNDMQEETTELKKHILAYFDTLLKAFDYDVEYKSDIQLTDLFKILSLHPHIDSDLMVANLLNFILFLCKYTSVKCFVILNLHLFFSEKEIELLYKDILNNHVNLLVLENKKSFKKSEFENIIICDNDMCEILDISEN